MAEFFLNIYGFYISAIFAKKHSDACIYLPPYKLDVPKIVKYKFLPRAIGLKFYYVIADPKVDDQHICPKFSKCNSFQVTSDFTHDGS